MYTNFIYHKDFISLMEQVLKHKGIINIGGPGKKSVYAFAKKDNATIKKEG